MQHFKSLFLFPIIALIAIILVNCQENPTPTAPENQSQQLLNKFSLGAGESLISATLYIRVAQANNQTVNIHRITSDWEEMVVTWTNFGGSFNSVVEGFFATGTVNEVWGTVNITPLVSSWLDGTYPNYGLLLDQVAQNYPRAIYYSRENVYIPYLEVVYSTGSGNVTIQLPAIADTYIYENNPNYNGGGSLELFTGWNDPNDKEKQTLIKFDVGTPDCETAYAYDDAPDGTCFIDLGFGNWGWSIKLPGPGTYTFDVYAGAGQCDLSKGTMVGTVTANYSGGTVSFSYNFLSGFSASETHFYAGTTPTPYFKGKPTVAPGIYRIGTGLSGQIYIIAHAVVCGDYSD